MVLLGTLELSCSAALPKINLGILGLAAHALEREKLVWPLLPKQHQMEHLIFEQAMFVNPRHCSCVLDEDLIGRIKNLAAHTHPSTMSLRVLHHYCLMAALVRKGVAVSHVDGPL